MRSDAVKRRNEIFALVAGLTAPVLFLGVVIAYTFVESRPDRLVVQLLWWLLLSAWVLAIGGIAGAVAIFMILKASSRLPQWLRLLAAAVLGWSTAFCIALLIQRRSRADRLPTLAMTYVVATIVA